MKFSNLLTLLAVTSAFALNSKRDDQSEQLGQTATQGEQANDGMASDEFYKCLSVLSNMTEKCYGTPIKTYEDFEKTNKMELDCKMVNSNECQTVLKDNSSGECGLALSSITPSMSLYCATNEKGDICPFSQAMQKKVEKITVDAHSAKSIGYSFSDKDIEETCKSKKCTEEALNLFKKMKKNGMISSEEEYIEMDKYITALGEEKCKAAVSNGTTQIKIGSALLATFALALYFF